MREKQASNLDRLWCRAASAGTHAAHPLRGLMPSCRPALTPACALETLVLGSTILTTAATTTTASQCLAQERLKAQREVARRASAAEGLQGEERAWDLPASCFILLRKNFKAKFSSASLGEQVLLPSAGPGTGCFDPICDSSMAWAVLRPSRLRSTQ